MLSITDHSRQVAGLRHVYPVLSRRAGGLSIGINLNPDSTCNWRCIYCQVPGLKRGRAPTLKLSLLHSELSGFLDGVLSGAFWEQQRVPPEQCRIRDIALSGNGEPTTSAQFAEVVELIAGILREKGLSGQVAPTLITNGSMLGRVQVRTGIQHISQLGGEVWFKIDSVSQHGMRRINQVQGSVEAVLNRLRRCASLCPVWIQTCMFTLDGVPPSETELAGWCSFLRQIRTERIPLRGMLLYGIARPSLQPEAPRLGRLSAASLRGIAQRLANQGVTVKTFP